jgi:flagellar capping protein FliD
MFDVSATVGVVGGVFGSITALGSVLYQRRQTLIMEAGLDRAANEDLDSPEVKTGTALERKLRMVINKRLSDYRTKMRQDYDPRLVRLEQMVSRYDFKVYDDNMRTLIGLLDDQKNIKDIATETREIRAEVLTAQERILAETGRYSVEIATHGREIESIQQHLEDLQNSIRAQMRAIAEHMLQMTGQG